MLFTAEDGVRFGGSGYSATPEVPDFSIHGGMISRGMRVVHTVDYAEEGGGGRVLSFFGKKKRVSYDSMSMDRDPTTDHQSSRHDIWHAGAVACTNIAADSFVPPEGELFGIPGSVVTFSGLYPVSHVNKRSLSPIPKPLYPSPKHSLPWGGVGNWSTDVQHALFPARSRPCFLFPMPGSDENAFIEGAPDFIVPFKGFIHSLFVS